MGTILSSLCIVLRGATAASMVLNTRFDILSQNCFPFHGTSHYVRIQLCQKVSRILMLDDFHKLAAKKLEQPITFFCYNAHLYNIYIITYIFIPIKFLMQQLFFACLSFSYLLMLVVGNGTPQQSLIFQLLLHRSLFLFWY